MVAKLKNVPEECANQVCAILQDETIRKFVALALVGIAATSVQIDEHHPFVAELLVANALKKKASLASHEPRIFLSVFQSKTTLKGYVLNGLTRETDGAECFRQECRLVAPCKYKYLCVTESTITAVDKELGCWLDSVMQKAGCKRVDKGEDAAKYSSTSADSVAFILITHNTDKATHEQMSWRLQNDTERLARHDLKLRRVLSSPPLVDPHQVARNMFVRHSPSTIGQAMKLVSNDIKPDDLQAEIAIIPETRELHAALAREIPGMSQRGLVNKFLQDLLLGFCCPWDVGPLNSSLLVEGCKFSNGGTGAVTVRYVNLPDLGKTYGSNGQEALQSLEESLGLPPCEPTRTRLYHGSKESRCQDMLKDGIVPVFFIAQADFGPAFYTSPDLRYVLDLAFSTRGQERVGLLVTDVMSASLQALAQDDQKNREQREGQGRVVEVSSPEPWNGVVRLFRQGRAASAMSLDGEQRWKRARVMVGPVTGNATAVERGLNPQPSAFMQYAFKVSACELLQSPQTIVHLLIIEEQQTEAN